MAERSNSEITELIRTQASEFDARSDLTPAVADAIVESDLMRILVPAEYGGLDGTLNDWFAACLPIAIADGSAGWVAAQGSVQNLLVASQSDPEFARAFCQAPRLNTALSFTGDVTLRPNDTGGWVVTGDWEYQSGCKSATCIGGLVSFVDTDFEPKPGLPYVLLWADEVRINETWDRVGMRGTGSHHVAVNDRTVPANRLVYFMNPAESRFRDHPLGRLGGGLVVIGLAATATLIGVARRALDEATALLRTKPQGPFAGEGVMIENHRVLSEVTRAEGLWDLTRLGFEGTLARLWEAASGPDPLSPEDEAQARLGAITAAHAAAQIVRDVYALCGTTPTASGTVLDRCFRDATTMATHGSIRTAGFERTGRALGLVPAPDESGSDQ
jgi:alkylation response protein AidB-like acyl-CoA dehydrogenase